MACVFLFLFLFSADSEVEVDEVIGWELSMVQSQVINILHVTKLLGASKVRANLYCNSRTSVLGRLRDYLRLLMKRSVHPGKILCLDIEIALFGHWKYYV